MGTARAKNIKIFNNRLRKYSESSVMPKIEMLLRNVAGKMIVAIDSAFVYPGGTSQFPVDSGNMHDATGVGVYVNGRLSSFLPTKYAVESQFYNEDDGIIGSEYLRNALVQAASTFSTGVWIVIFSATPYAYEVNLKGSPIYRGQDFFKRLESLLIDEVFAGLRPITDISNPYSFGL